MRRSEMTQHTDISRAAMRRASPFEELLRLLNSPRDVLNDPRLRLDEKRALLASWASDLHAVENQPMVRKLGNGKVIPLEDILSCLMSLDQESGSGKRSRPPAMHRHAFNRRRNVGGWRRKWQINRGDDDDDPPPCAAMACPRAPSGGQSGARVVAGGELAYA